MFAFLRVFKLPKSKCCTQSNNSATIRNMEGIVLALGGGGVRGGAHIAVLDVLTEARIPIVGLAGSSAGALAAAAYASGIAVHHNDLSEWL